VFFRFPHTPHLVWLAAGRPRDDKLLSPEEARAFLSGEVLVEEKVDGANVGLSLSGTGELRAQNRGSYLTRGRAAPQFHPLWAWLDTRRAVLEAALGRHLILFGEWCFAVHTVRYDRLPDWFLAFDVYDRSAGQFWNAERRDALVPECGLAAIPRLGAGRFSVEQIRQFLGPSRLGSGPMEGVYLRRDQGDWLLDRAKVVRPEFAQGIGEHWSARHLEKNSLSSSAPALSSPARSVAGSRAPRAGSARTGPARRSNRA